MQNLLKYKQFYLIPIVSLVVLFGLSCTQETPATPQQAPSPAATPPPNFGDYWYQGKAEINSYQLTQARYGELRKSQAVRLFVTEDFSASKQVKTTPNANDAVKVLKMNLSKQFVTGIYDYAIMQSVFTPIGYSKQNRSLKTTTSTQDWCGQTFTQVNRQADQYKVQLFSYFESEGDRNYPLKQTYLEDELWNIIRINPKKLPTGEMTIIPNAATSRLRHTKLSSEAAQAKLFANKKNKNLMTYQLDYAASKRTLKIFFQKEFPHQIEGWEDSYIDGGKYLTTKAKRIKTILSPYWNKSSNRYQELRDSLGL